MVIWVRSPSRLHQIFLEQQKEWENISSSEEWKKFPSLKVEILKIKNIYDKTQLEEKNKELKQALENIQEELVSNKGGIRELKETIAHMYKSSQHMAS